MADASRVNGRRGLPALIATAVLAAALGPAPGAGASAHPSVRLDRSPAEVRAYWTAQRMRDAVPADRLLQGVALPDAPLPPREVGEPAAVGPAAPAGRAGPAAAAKALPDLLGGGGAQRRASAIPNPRQSPFRTHGKVFLTLSDGVPGTPDDYVCSATVVSSKNKRVVVTAGHCVHGFGRFASNWMFVPAYDGSKEPFGRWSAARLATTSQWANREDLRYDVGIARMAKLRGRRIQAVVGARGIGFNRDPKRYHAYGYPAESPYDGRRLYMCDSPAQGSDPDFSEPRPRRIECDMTAGSSGGGWVVRERIVNSVVSYGYECVTDPLDPLGIFPCENPEEGKLFGPYFGETIRRLYAAEQRRLRR